MRFKGAIALVGTILLAEALLTGLIPHSRGYLFDLLDAKSGPIWIALGIYFSNYLGIDFFQSIKAYFVIKLSLLFRTDRTHKVTESLKPNISNTPQRIQEDIKLSYHSRLLVWCEYIVSGIIVIQLLYINVDEPILVGAALVYSLISVGIAILFNPRLTRVEKDVQQIEASYRTGLINSLSLHLLPSVNKTNIVAAQVRMEYLLFTRLQLGLITVLPYIVLIPSLLDGTIGLGDLMKHQATFALIVVNAAILINFYPKLVQGRASDERVREIEND